MVSDTELHGPIVHLYLFGKNVCFDPLPIFNGIVCFLLFSFMCSLYTLDIKSITCEGKINKMNFIKIENFC